VRAAYEEWAVNYDSDENATRDLDAIVLRSASLPLDGASVVEIGAGTGKNTAYLAAHAKRVLALDLSPAMLARACERVAAGHVRFVEHDITRPWPALDRQIDIVVGNLVLEHVPDLRPVFAEARRVLKPGGVMFLCELHPCRQLRGGQARFESGGRSMLIEAYPHTVAEYVNTALGQGFEVVRLSEWREESAGSEPPASTPPRLLSMLFRRG
jgi:ubiquinone/menaquinone biosynthesis C-methylase UbiE